MNLIFVRFKSSKVGGAEKYLLRLKNSLISQSNVIQEPNPIYPKIEVFSSGDYGQSSELHIALPAFLPSFLKFLYFLIAYEK